MANLNETDLWEPGIYQLEEDDPVLGGPQGIDNLAPRQLASRSRYQRLRNVTPWLIGFAYPVDAYVSDGGTTWKSIAASTGVKPGTDATKWVRWGYTAAELAAALGGSVAAHEAKPDAHPQYALDSDLAAHVAAANPHPGYATDADLAAHVAAADPHPAYALDSDLAAHVAAANPHPGYATDADLAAHVAAADPHPQYATDLDVQKNAPTYALDIGVANACVVAYTPAITALTDGMVLWFKAKVTNTGATTLNVNGLGAKAVVGSAHQALQGGEIAANGLCLVVWNATYNVFVLIGGTGGAQQVGPAWKSSHAVQLSQLLAPIAKAGELTEIKVTTACSYYKLSIDGITVIEIDFVNMVEIVDGVDHLAQIRLALGML